MMKQVHILESTALPLDRSDVDTDQIIPSEWLKQIGRTGFAPGLFSEWREDRDFVLNQPQFAGSEFLVAGPNFGTGSSREHAVWALMNYGFTAIISPRFGDIFRNNSTKNGLVPVQVSAKTGRDLMDAVVANPSLIMIVDVERRLLSVPMAGIEEEFPLDDATRERFLEGIDDVGITMRSAAKIDDFEQVRAPWLPKVQQS
jgi:3-isopropylmalate/(R)-2-methylmalate dehydratase small subunit